MAFSDRRVGRFSPVSLIVHLGPVRPPSHRPFDGRLLTLAYCRPISQVWCLDFECGQKSDLCSTDVAVGCIYGLFNMVRGPSLVRSSILNTTQDALFRLRVFSPQLLSLKFLHLVSQVAISNHAHSFSLHPLPCQDDWPSPPSTECNRKVLMAWGSMKES